MPDSLEEGLSLDISDALAAVGQLDDALQQVVQGFSVGLASALETLTGVGAGDTASLASQLDTSGLTSSIDQAISDAVDAPQPPLEITGDTAPLTDAIDAATTGIAPPVVPVDADTAPAQATIAGLGDEPPVVVPVEADPTSLEKSIDDFQASVASGLIVVVPVTADTTAAQDAIDSIDTTEATDAFDAVGTSAQTAGTSISGISNTLSTVLEGSASLASGEVADLNSNLGGLGIGAVGAGVGVLALAGFIDKVVVSAAEGQAANNLFNATFGDMASAVQKIDVGGLSISFDDLASKSGTVTSDLQLAAARIGELGNSSGAAAGQVVATTDQVLALGGTLSVTNPALGDAATVTSLLTRQLETGGARLAQYGISLSSAQINAKALSLGLAQSTDQLTPFDKLVAGADLAVAEFGDTLGLKFAAGSQNAQVQLRALKASFEDTLSAIGQPLLQPTINAFADLLPVLTQVGKFLGDLGQIAIPLFDALTPLIAAAVSPLKLVGDGLTAVGDALGHIPPEALTAIAAGLLAIGAATGALDGVIAALLDINPVILGITVALAAAGAVFDAFSAHSKAISDDTKDFTTALFGAGSSATTFEAQVGQLNTSLDAVTAKFIESAPSADGFRTALDGVGGGAAGLSAALTGTQAAFDAYVKNVDDASGANNSFDATFGFAKAALDDQRDALQKSETQQLANLVSTNQLTQAQLDQIDKTFQLGTAHANLTGALKQAAVETQQDTDAQTAAANAAALANGAFTGLYAQIKSGAVTSADAVTVAEQLGISTADATTLIKDQTDALTAQSDATIIASPAAQDLADKFAAGSINAAQYELALAQLGVSIPALAADVKPLSDAITAANTALAEASPAVKDVAEQLQTGAINTAQATAAFIALGVPVADVTSFVQGLAKDLPALGAAQDAVTARTLDSTAAFSKLVSEIADGTLTIPQAEAQFEALGLSIPGATTAVNALQSAISSAVSGIVKDLPQASDAASTWAQNLTSAATAYSDAVNAAKQNTTTIEADFATLAADSDPAKFAKNLDTQILDSLSFTENIQKLLSEGLGQLAGFVAQQPFSVAGPLANALAHDSKGNAELAQATLGISQEVTGGAQAFFNKEAGPLGLAAGTQIANGVVVGLRAGQPALFGAGSDAAQTAASGFKPDLFAAISPALAAAEAKLAGDKSISEAAGTKGVQAVIAFENAFGPVSLDGAIKIALAAAATTTGTDQTVPTAAGKKGTDTKTAFQSSADIKNAVQVQFQAGADAVAKFTGLAINAGILGKDVGVAFDSGIAEGIVAGQTDITTAATAAAGAAEIAARDRLQSKSPSLVGVAIGQDFIAGLVIGLGDTTPLQKATALVATALVDAQKQANAAANRAAIIGTNDQPIATNVTFDNATAKQLADQQTLALANANATSTLVAERTAYLAWVTAVESKAPGATIAADLKTFTAAQKDAIVARNADVVATNAQINAHKDLLKAQQSVIAAQQVRVNAAKTDTQNQIDLTRQQDTFAKDPINTKGGKRVNVQVDLHKVDVDPVHLATEIAWRVGA